VRRDGEFIAFIKPDSPKRTGKIFCGFIRPDAAGGRYHHSLLRKKIRTVKHEAQMVD
jgi:hypothetical protein